MLKPSVAFSIGSTVAMLSWLCQSISLFLSDPVRNAVWSGTTLLVPAVLAFAYTVFIVRGFRDGTGGGFGSIAAVRQLFTSDAALAAGWLHYLAFDLFVGSWIAQVGIAEGMPRLLILICLPLTFFAGPVGLLLFLVLRFALVGQLGLPA